MKHEAEIIRYDLNINDILSSCSVEKFKVKKSVKKKQQIKAKKVDTINITFLSTEGNFRQN